MEEGKRTYKSNLAGREDDRALDLGDLAVRRCVSHLDAWLCCSVPTTISLASDLVLPSAFALPSPIAPIMGTGTEVDNDGPFWVVLGGTEEMTGIWQYQRYALVFSSTRTCP